jgi:cyanophycin synthetase
VINSTLKSFHVKFLHCYPGAREGLDEKTAIVTLAQDGVIADWPRVEANFRAQVDRLCSTQALLDRHSNSWPDDFILYRAGEERGWPNLAHWVIALTVQIQRWARDPVRCGRVLSVSDASLTLAIPWWREPEFRAALTFALRFLLQWLQPQLAAEMATSLKASFQQWLVSAQSTGLAPNTLCFAQAAQERGIPLNMGQGFILLGWGANARRLDSSFTGSTSNLAARIALNKLQTNRLLAEAALPVPAAATAPNRESALKLAQQLGWPVVIKPSHQDQGVGVVPGIRSEAVLHHAFDQAARFRPGAVIVEKHIEGDDHRMLVVGGKLLMVTKRIPGGVQGDGIHTLMQLMDAVNADPRRGTGKRSLLIRLKLDTEATDCLADQGLTSSTVPEAGRFVRLRRTANISTGGTAVDVSDHIHPDNQVLAERAARLIGLDIAGVDFLCPDISRSWREVGGAICEVNAQPGFRVHWLGNPARDINGEVIDWLFKDKPARIPSAAITGTNGKSTVARMLHHIWMIAGKVAGVCTTNGVWVGHELVSDQNLSGQPGAKLLLNDSSVEVAVIEMPRKGLLVFGHPCDRYDVAALLNVQDDHIGVDGIDSLESMANLKAEVLERASQAIVINADDSRCLAVRAKANVQRQILVARDGQNPAVREHLTQGGEAVFIQLQQTVPWIILAEGASQTPLMPLYDIPATMNGLLRFNESNTLFAVALAWAQGVAQETIKKALRIFANVPAQNPGRYNFIQGFPFQVLLDFGHNPVGLLGLCELATQLPVVGKRRLLNVMVDNRFRSHLDALVHQTVPLFDDFVLSGRPSVVRQSADWRGEAPLQNMLEHGRAAILARGVDAAAVVLEADQADAIRLSLARTQPGDLLVLLAEPWVALPILNAAIQPNR